MKVLYSRCYINFSCIEQHLNQQSGVFWPLGRNRNKTNMSELSPRKLRTFWCTDVYFNPADAEKCEHSVWDIWPPYECQSYFHSFFQICFGCQPVTEEKSAICCTTIYLLSFSVCMFMLVDSMLATVDETLRKVHKVTSFGLSQKIWPESFTKKPTVQQL